MLSLPLREKTRFAAPRLFLVLSLLFSAFIGQPSAGLAQNGEFSTRARQTVLMDADSGAILYQHNANELMSPASMSKLMTLAVLFKALKSGAIKPMDQILVSEYAWRKGGAPAGGSAMMVPVNTRVRVEELLQGIVIQSGNDAAIAVAEALAGSEAAFGNMLTEEARKLGLKKSTFKNATGLYHPEHLATARELAVLACHIINEYPEYYRLFAQREFQYRKHRFTNRNPLLSTEIGVDGLKTGYVKASGYGMVASAKRGERRLVAVVNGLATADQRKDEVQRLLEWGFRSFAEFQLFSAGDIVAHARVWGGDRFYLPLTGNGDVNVVLPRSAAKQRLRAELVYHSPLKPPIKRGEPVAKLRVTSSSYATDEVTLYAAENVEAAGMLRRGLDSLAHLAFGWIP
jgi:D-alanyl-D-alanine carboxypeptidase (penicillin-binding protein 5/6)